MTELTRRLSLPEAIGLSVSMICPTVTAAFNITLVVQATGRAAPLAFAIGTLAMALAALAFIACSRRVAHAGSAYAYISHTFGSRWGFVAGWSLLLTYVGFTTGLAALVGSFASAALMGLGIDIGSGWLLIASLSILLAWWLGIRDMRLAGRLMLGLESVAILGILVLCVVILNRTRPGLDATLATLQPASQSGGWRGVGLSMVFSILSFAGFEGAATLGEETRNPQRSIPIAMLATVVGSGLFFVFVAYCEVIGFGEGGLAMLAKSQAPLNDLALRYASPGVAIALDLAAALSCLASVIGSLAAAARVLFALGRGGLAPILGTVHSKHGTPAAAVSLTAILVVLPFFAWAPFAGAGNYYSYTSTVGVLALILVYVGVAGAEIFESWRERRFLWSAICLLGPGLLVWVLYRSVVPPPVFPNNLWPYLVASWAAASFGLMRWRPALARSPLAELS